MKKRFLLTLLMIALVLCVAVISVAAAAPAGIGVEDGKLIGLDSAKTYEYAKVTFPAGTVDEASYADYTDGAILPAGVYSVREKDTTDAATVWVKGAGYGTLSFANSATESAGAWTFVYPGGTINPTASTTQKGLSHQITYAAQENYNAGAYIYNFTDDEIIPVYDLLNFKFKTSSSAGKNHVKSNTGKAYGLVTAYVYGGTVASYSVPFTWDCNLPTTDIPAVDFTTVYDGIPAGYVYKLEIDFCDETNPKWTEDGVVPCEETELYQNEGKGAWYTWRRIQFTFTDDTISRIPLTLRTPEVAPVLGIEGTDTDGVYRITGLDASKRYAISSDNVTFEDVAANSTYVDVRGTGTYYVYTKGGSTTSRSESASVTVAGAQPTIAKDALYYDKATGSIKGFDTLASDKTVEYGKASVDGKITWLSTIDAASITVGYGNYAFRYVASGEYVAGAPTYVFAYEGGSNKGAISFKAGDPVDAYVQGQWTSFYLPKTNRILDPYNAGGTRIAIRFNTYIEDATYLGYRYALQDNEVFPLSELKSLTFSLGCENTTGYNVTTHPGYVRIYVAGGDELYYDLPIESKHKVITTYGVSSLWEDEVAADPNFIPKGYVVGWDIHYFREGTTENLGWPTGKTGPFEEYAMLNTNGIDTTTLMTSKFVALKETIKIDALSTVPALEKVGGEITGLNPNATYLFALYDKTTGTTGEWAAITGVESVRDLPAGAYAIRGVASATDANYASSDVTVVEITTLDTQGRDTVKMDKIVLPEDITVADAEYVFDVDASRWINRLALSNIAYDSPDSNIVFKSENYKFTVAASDIDLSLEATHYFDMKVTFDGESAYDRMYDKMAAVADEKELVKGVHFESTSKYFFEKATFEVYLGDKYDGYEVELRSYNERVGRLRVEETVTVEGGWASFTMFGGDYIIISPAFAKDN